MELPEDQKALLTEKLKLDYITAHLEAYWSLGTCSFSSYLYTKYTVQYLMHKILHFDM